MHVLLHNSIKPPEKPPERPDEKQITQLNQRVSQLTENNLALKAEIERLKYGPAKSFVTAIQISLENVDLAIENIFFRANVIRMEESVLVNEKRLQEKMHECAQLGGELDRSRDEAARALQRANDRQETIKKFDFMFATYTILVASATLLLFPRRTLSWQMARCDGLRGIPARSEFRCKLHRNFVTLCLYK